MNPEGTLANTPLREASEVAPELPLTAPISALRQGALFGARALGLGVLPSVLLYMGLFVSCLIVDTQADYMGVQTPGLQESLMKLFWGDILSQQTALAGVYARIGVYAGLIAFLLLSSVWSWRRSNPRWPIQILAVVGLVALVHCLLLMRSIGTYPQLYDGVNETLTRLLFPLAVDVLSPTIIDWTLGAMAAAFAFFVLAHIPRLPDFDIWGWYVGGLAIGTAATLPFFFLQGEPTAGGERQKPNVLILAVDSLRGDMLEDTEATPQLNAFAERSVRFTNAHSVIGRTMPSWVSILTGQYPHTHGIRHMFPALSNDRRVPVSVVDAARLAGYSTGVITDSAGEIFSRIDLGFSDVDAPNFTLKSNIELGGMKPHVHLMPNLVDIDKGKRAPILHAHESIGDPFWLTNRAKAWIDDRLHEPFMLTVFYSSGHFPFASPSPYHKQFTDPDYRGRSRFQKATFNHPLSGDEKSQEEAHIRGLYRGAIAASDAAIGELLTHLQEHGLLDNTIVIITADHGENTYETDLGVGHGDHLYGRAGHHVPLLIHRPGGLDAGSMVTRQVRTVDIAPTLFSLLGFKAPMRMDGTSLLPLGDETDLPVFAETGLWFFPSETKRLQGRQITFFDGFSPFRFQDGSTAIYLNPEFDESVVMAKHRMLQNDGWKLLYIPTRDGVRWELYDLEKDPQEHEDLAAVPAAKERLESMQATMLAWLLEDEGAAKVGDFVVPKRPLGWEHEGESR
jgi:arylsulfatase A-like enzyme